MTAYVPLVQPMDLSRWQHQPFSSHVQISHDRYHERDDSSPCPMPETPEFEHTHPTSMSAFDTPPISYLTSSPEASSTWAKRPTHFSPLAYKSGISHPAEAYEPRMPPTYSYAQPYGNWAPIETSRNDGENGNGNEIEVDLVQERSEKSRRHVW